ncbi:MAG: sortase, partial [Oscillospiraceae bacterium]|nr:sortase [Oscillospiraceae bacterium]
MMCSLTLLLATAVITPASALEYADQDAAAGSFGKPTSVEPVTVVGGVNTYETDVSKNAAYIPPAFGSPMADLPGSGELLTPNLASGGTGTITGGGTGAIIPPSTSGGTTDGVASTGYTAVTSDLYYSNGHLGTLSAPAIGLSVKVYQGTDSDALRKGAG